MSSTSRRFPMPPGTHSPGNEPENQQPQQEMPQRTGRRVVNVQNKGSIDSNQLPPFGNQNPNAVPVSDYYQANQRRPGIITEDVKRQMDAFSASAFDGPPQQNQNPVPESPFAQFEVDTTPMGDVNRGAQPQHEEVAPPVNPQDATRHAMAHLQREQPARSQDDIRRGLNSVGENQPNWPTFAQSENQQQPQRPPQNPQADGFDQTVNFGQQPNDPNARPEFGSRPPNLEFDKIREQMQRSQAEFAQRGQQRAAAQQAKPNPEDKSLLVAGRVNSAPSEQYRRVELPSRGVFYPSAIFCRPLSPREVMHLASIRRSEDQSMLFDVLNNCVQNFDLRDLTLADFNFFFYWLRLNTFPSKPIKIRYISKYGNENQVEIAATNLSVTTLDITAEDYAKWCEKGFVAPSLRDGEEFNREIAKYSEQEKATLTYAFSYAQFLQGDTIAEKLEKYYQLSTETMFEIIEFSEIFKYGVEEQVDVFDAKFNTQDAIAKLKADLADFEELDTTEIVNPVALQRLRAVQQEIRDDLDRIMRESETSNTGEAAPSSETITFQLNVEDFFPENLVENRKSRR